MKEEKETKRMKKTLCRMSLTIALILSVITSGCAAAPQANILSMGYEDLRAFFARPFTGVSGIDLLTLYEILAQNDVPVYGMRFSATQDSIDPADPYANDLVDFELSVGEDVYVILAGYYGSWGSLMLPEPYLLEQGKEYPLLGTVGIEYTYAKILDQVKDFECVAIPVTDSLKAALAGKIDLSAYKSASEDVPITLKLQMYEVDENGDKTNNEITIAERTVGRPMVAPAASSAPKTGDVSKPLLWAALCAASLSVVMINRKKRFVQ